MIVIKRILSIFLVILTLFSSIPFSLSWDGDSAGGSIDAVNGSNTGYVIRDTEDSNCVVGYRFSAVDADGNMKVTKVIDVYRDKYGAVYLLSLCFLSVAKRMKKLKKCVTFCCFRDYINKGIMIIAYFCNCTYSKPVFCTLLSSRCNFCGCHTAVP